MATGRCQVAEKTETGYRVVLKDGWFFPDGTSTAEAPTSGELMDWVLQSDLRLDPAKPIQRNIIDHLGRWTLFARTITSQGEWSDWYFRKQKGQFEVQPVVGWPDSILIRGRAIPVSQAVGLDCYEKAKLLDREAPRVHQDLEFVSCIDKEEDRDWPVDATWFNGELHDIKWTEDRPFLRTRLTLPLTGRGKVRRSAVVQREDGPYLLFQCDPLAYDEVSEIFKGKVV